MSLPPRSVRVPRCDSLPCCDRWRQQLPSDYGEAHRRCKEDFASCTHELLAVTPVYNSVVLFHPHPKRLPSSLLPPPPLFHISPSRPPPLFLSDSEAQGHQAPRPAGQAVVPEPGHLEQRWPGTVAGRRPCQATTSSRPDGEGRWAAAGRGWVSPRCRGLKGATGQGAGASRGGDNRDRRRRG